MATIKSTLYIVQVKRGRKTSYHYADTVKAGIKALKIKKGEFFSYHHFERTMTRSAEMITASAYI